MKRYNIKADYDTAGYGTYEEEDPEGEWVKHKSVLNLLGAISICNCKESVEKRTWGIPFSEISKFGYNPPCPYWICPAHGYKKI